MATILVTRRHQLDEETVRNEVEKLAEILAEKLDADYQWLDNRIVFKRTGANGYLQLSKGEIEIKVELGMLLSPFKHKIESVINTYMDDELSA